jgi:hypothetical protein
MMFTKNNIMLITIENLLRLINNKIKTMGMKIIENIMGQ